jgi:hypothetical protein
MSPRLASMADEDMRAMLDAIETHLGTVRER